jgi:uncharacterized protein YjbI with pentapeptide repeats
LREPDFCDANLTGADLIGADLHRANLAGTILHSANLTDASLLHTVFNNVDLTSIVGLEHIGTGGRALSTIRPFKNLASRRFHFFAGSIYRTR